MKRIAFLVGLFIFFAGSGFSQVQGGAMPAVQEPMNLRYAYGGPNQGPFAEANQWFCDQITKRTNSKIKITIHWGGTLVSQADTLTSVGKGVVAMGAAMGGTTVSQNPHWSTLSMVGAGKDQWAIMWATYEMIKNNATIKAEMDKHNVVGTHGYFPGTPILVLRKKVASLKDLRGLRIRAATPDEAAAWARLGVETVQIAPFDVYDSMSKGVIDGCLFTVTWADTLKLGEVAKYWYRFSDNLLGGDVTTVINKDIWNKFTTETKAIIEQLIKEYNDLYTKNVLSLEEQIVNKAKSSIGVQYVKMVDEVDKAYTAAIDVAHQAWFDKWDKSGNTTRAIWDQYEQYVDKYEKEAAEKGYPWNR